MSYVKHNIKFCHIVYTFFTVLCTVLIDYEIQVESKDIYIIFN